MGYEAALNKAWEELSRLKHDKTVAVKFLADEYTLDFENQRVMSLSCNVPAKDFTAILILHYFISRLKGLPALSAEWATFKELAGVEGYYPAFRKRSIDIIIKKYGKNPEKLLEVLDRLPAKRVKQGDIAIVLDTLEQVPALVTLWRGDEEFGPEANILFDKSISKIFCIEDIIVLAGFIAMQL